jgi:hypothetical protein
MSKYHKLCSVGSNFCVLKYGWTYQLLHQLQADRDRYCKLVEKLNRSALLQLTLMEPGDRPADYMMVVTQFPQPGHFLQVMDFAKPSFWQYHDEEMAAYLENLIPVRP